MNIIFSSISTLSLASSRCPKSSSFHTIFHHLCSTGILSLLLQISFLHLELGKRPRHLVLSILISSEIYPQVISVKLGISSYNSTLRSHHPSETTFCNNSHLKSPPYDHFTTDINQIYLEYSVPTNNREIDASSITYSLFQFRQRGRYQSQNLYYHNILLSQQFIFSTG